MNDSESRFVAARAHWLWGLSVTIGTLLLPLISVATADLPPLQPRTVYWGNAGAPHETDYSPHYRTTPVVVEERSGSVYDRNSSTNNYGTTPITPNTTSDRPYRSSCGNDESYGHGHGTCTD